MTIPNASVGDVLGNSGPPQEITWDGKKLPVAWPDLTVLARVEKLVVRRAIDAVDSLKNVLTPAEMAEQKADLNDQIRARQHTTGGKMWIAEFAADGGVRGIQLMLWACLAEGRDRLRAVERASVPEVSFEQVPKVMSESADVASVLATVIPDFIQAVAKAKGVPTAMLQELMDGIPKLQA